MRAISLVLTAILSVSALAQPAPVRISTFKATSESDEIHVHRNAQNRLILQACRGATCLPIGDPAGYSRDEIELAMAETNANFQIEMANFSIPYLIKAKVLEGVTYIGIAVTVIGLIGLIWLPAAIYGAAAGFVLTLGGAGLAYFNGIEAANQVTIFVAEKQPAIRQILLAEMIIRNSDPKISLSKNVEYTGVAFATLVDDLTTLTRRADRLTGRPQMSGPAFSPSVNVPRP